MMDADELTTERTGWSLGPSTGPTGDPFRDCVRCGLCLEACPTYRLHADEAQSPRGRILILDALRGEALPAEEDIIEPLESCLVCRSCETACPSGVQFGHLMEKGRATLNVQGAWRRSSPGRRFFARAILSAIQDPGRRRFFARLLRFVQSSGLQSRMLRSRVLSDAAPWLKDALTLLPTLDEPFAPSPESVSRSLGLVQAGDFQALEGRRHRETETEEAAGDVVQVFTGCVTPWVFPKVSRAVDRLVRAAGHRPLYPMEQTCCGALHLHEGDEEAARSLARRNILAFETDPHAPILVEAAGCGAVLKSYEDLLSDIPLYKDRAHDFSRRVKDLSEWLAEKGLPKRSPVGVKVAFQDPCHLYHVQGIRSAPRQLLEDVAGVEIVDVEERDICCGSAGISNLLESENGQALGEEKARVLARSKPDLVVTSNPGCLLQLQRHMKRHGIPVRHLAHVLEAYASLPIASERSSLPDAGSPNRDG